MSDLGLATAGDREIFDQAQRTKAVLVTRDVVNAVGTLADSEFENAVIIVEEARFRRRTI